MNESTHRLPQARSNELDFWKFIFSFVIVILHSEYLPTDAAHTYLHGGSIFVEFFFITSGYLMAKSAEKRENYTNLADETSVFLKKKIAAFFPYLIFGFVVSLVARSLYNGNSFLGFIKNACNGITEMLLLKATGMTKTLFNAPMWYLSAMVISMAVLYPLLLKFKDIFRRIVCPLIAFFLLGYLHVKYDHLRSPDVWDGLFFKGTIRGFAEIALGVFCYEIGKFVSRYQFTTFSKLLFTIVEYGSLIAIIAYSNTDSCWDMDIPSVLLFAASIVIICNNLSLLSPFWNRLKITPKLGKFSMMLYINHIYWVWIFDVMGLQMSYNKMLIAYAACSIVSALLCWGIVDLIRAGYKKYKLPIKSLFIRS